MTKTWKLWSRRFQILDPLPPYGALFHILNMGAFPRKWWTVSRKAQERVQESLGPEPAKSGRGPRFFSDPSRRTGRRRVLALLALRWFP